ncbi:MAG TPA: hypothetical protein VHA52_05800, partial [Candidatus Babeliaceae bacterium]|nr:hypothetical protein [Candidatus Babeliaceae bacterium]
CMVSRFCARCRPILLGNPVSLSHIIGRHGKGMGNRTLTLYGARRGKSFGTFNLNTYEDNHPSCRPDE